MTIAIEQFCGLKALAIDSLTKCDFKALTIDRLTKCDLEALTVQQFKQV